MICQLHAFRIGVFKPVPGDAEQGGIYAASIKRAHVRLEVRIPRTRLDLLFYPLTLALKFFMRSAVQHPFLTKRQQTVQRRPAHEAGMRVVLSSAAWFPNAFIRLVPMPGNILPQLDQYVLRSAVKPSLDLSKLRRRVNDLAIDIKLKLMASTIADPHRARSEKAAQVIKFALARGETAKDVIHYAQFRLRQARGMQQPGQKSFRFLHVPQPKHGAYGQ